ncbi:MAG: YbaB/EbfC family nucleoid-associated protein [Chitinophagales bacterium]|nr:YbaB/EbfC family nucleoid-associated protein [Chitinophagales bacterium]
MLDMLGQFGNIQQKAEEMRKRLDNVSVAGEAEGVKATMNGNRKLLNIEIAEHIFQEGDKEQLEDLITIAINRALEQAEAVTASETAAMYREMLPGFPGL